MKTWTVYLITDQGNKQIQIIAHNRSEVYSIIYSTNPSAIIDKVTYDCEGPFEDDYENAWAAIEVLDAKERSRYNATYPDYEEMIGE